MTINKILIAVDDSKYAENAAKLGFDLAHTFKAAVGLISNVEPMYHSGSNTDTITGFPVETVNYNEVDMLKIQSESADNIMHQMVKKLAPADMHISYFTEVGLTADSILKCANEFGADMIVLGTHSRTGIDRFIMGSVAEDVIRHSPVPVLVVPLKVAE